MTTNSKSLELTAPAPILTQHNDNNRSGTNLDETILNTSNVNPNQFGKLFSRQVDGQIYAQPLYLSSVEIQKIASTEFHNIVYIATMHNTVYAFDADDPNASQPLWSTNLGPSIPLPDPNIGTTGYIKVEVGILSTPVISIANNTIYVVSTNKDPNKPTSDPSAYSHRLYALDIMNGGIVNSVLIAGTYPGTASDGSNGIVTFNSQRQLQRSSLLLSNNRIYVAFASHEDITPSHGWIMSYDANTLEQIAVFNTTPNGELGTIWQGGQGPASDQYGNIYFSTGNGDFDGNNLTPTNPTPTNLGDCVVKLSPNLKLLDWFSPFDNTFLNQTDTDLGSGGVLLLPKLTGTNKDLLIAGGKGSKTYLIDRNNMGHFNLSNDSQIVQSFYISNGDGSCPLINGPVYWNEFVYFAPSDGVKAYRFNETTGIFDTNPASQGTVFLDYFGGWMSISANGDKEGILFISGHKNVLQAFDASNLQTELWNSNMNVSRDAIKTTSKFCPVTIANGKVYVPTFDNQFIVYGLL